MNNNFNCAFDNSVKELNYQSEIIKGDFSCNWCINLKELKGAPVVVEGNFSCANCPQLTSLKGAPEIVKGNFDCAFCQNLETLEGAPKRCKTFNCEGCEKLKNLDPLLRCEIEEVIADTHLLEDFKKKRAIIVKHGIENAMQVLEMIEVIL